MSTLFQYSSQPNDRGVCLQHKWRSTGRKIRIGLALISGMKMHWHDTPFCINPCRGQQHQQICAHISYSKKQGPRIDEGQLVLVRFAPHVPYWISSAEKMWPK